MAVSQDTIIRWSHLGTFAAETKTRIAAGDEATLTAAKGYYDTKMKELVGTAPETLDEIHEIAAAISENQDAIDVIEQGIVNKADKTPFTGASSSAGGAQGLVPAPALGEEAKFLKADGTWGTPVGTTYEEATGDTAGLMSAADKTALDGLKTVGTISPDDIAGLFA